MATQSPRPTLTELVTEILTILRRMETGAPAPAPPKGETLSLLDAIAETYGAEEAETVSAHLDTLRAQAEQEAEEAAKPKRRASPRRWSAEFPEMRALLTTWNESKNKAAYYETRLQTETDPTSRQFFADELRKHTEIAREARRGYDRRVKTWKRAAKQNQH